MFRVKVKFLSLAGILLLFFRILLVGQTFEDQFKENFERASKYLNIDSDSILFYANVAFSESIKLQNPNLQLDALKLIIQAQVKLGNYSQAILSCSKADSINANNSFLNREPEILMFKGLVFQTAGFVSEGLSYLFQAEKQIETGGNKEIIGDLFYYIALANFNINELNSCRNYAKKAVAIERKRNNLPGLVKNYILLSNSYNNIDSIQKYLAKANEIINTDEMEYKKAILLSCEAMLHKALGHISEAKEAYNKAINIASSNIYKEILSNLFNNYAYLLMMENKSDSINIVLKNALSLAQELNNMDLEASIMDTYSDYYNYIGDTINAFNYYKKSIYLKNQFREKQRIEQSLFLTTVFETEKKEKEIARQESKLYQINTILFAVFALFSVAVAILFYFRQKSAARKVKIKAMEHEAKLEIANALIEGQDAERKRLAMDLHDGISPRIGLLKMKLDNSIKRSKSYNDIVESVTDIGRSIRDMSHRMLPPQLDSHGLVKALENMIYILERNSKIRFTFYTNLKERLNYKLEVNLFYLSYEIINNAVKHSGGTEINIQLLSDNESLSLSVEDDGKGFNTRSDFNGLGLKNIRQRVKYLEGKLTLDTEIGQGTAIIIEVKL